MIGTGGEVLQGAAAAGGHRATSFREALASGGRPVGAGSWDRRAAGALGG